MDFGSFRDGDAFQVIAEGEGTFSDFFQLGAFREDDRPEIMAIVECLLSNALHARRYLHLCDAGPRERTSSDLPQLGTLCEGNFAELFAIFECVAADSMNIFVDVHFFDICSAEAIHIEHSYIFRNCEYLGLLLAEHLSDHICG